MKLTGWHWAAIGSAVAVAGSGIAWLLLPRENDPHGETVSDDDPTSPNQPHGLALASGETFPVYCFARAIASEEGGQPRTHQVAVACAILNFALSEHPSDSEEDALVKLILGSSGEFGRQGSGGRRVSSARAPGYLQFRIAHDVLAGVEPDVTMGATQFDSPSGQRALLAKGDPETRKTPEEIAASRIAKGYELVTVPGIDPDDLRFWRRVG
jgi:hypothetical protein